MPLGRLASAVAQLIRGKHKPTFTPHIDGGDFVVVVNAAKVKLTGRKLDQKRYFRHTGYMGHERFTPVRDMLSKHPGPGHREGRLRHAAEELAVQAAAPEKLKVYAAGPHPHAAQQPKPLRRIKVSA